MAVAVRRFERFLWFSTRFSTSRRFAGSFRRVSELLQPSRISPDKKGQLGSKQKAIISKSQRLLVDNGIVRVSSRGMFDLLPLGCRAMEKLSKIIEKQMDEIKGQKIEMPTLIDADLWKTSGRKEAMGHDLLHTRDRDGKEFCFSPTYEEAVTEIVAGLGAHPSYKQFPLRLYQISRKFRDEMLPRYGLLRAKEFLMKDLYSFDVNKEKAMESYRLVCRQYQKLFEILDVSFKKVEGDSGHIGGPLSHEFHILSDIGEDTLLLCPGCDYAANKALLGENMICRSCKKEMEIKKGIEVCHSFYLGTKYSKIFNAKFRDSDSQTRVLEMGCFGIGVSRLLAACAEVLSPQNEIRWPLRLAPFVICIIPPKRGSKEWTASEIADVLCGDLSSLFPDDIILDDRTDDTIGKRVIDAKKTGYPYIVIVAKRALETEPQFELIEVSNGKTHFLPKHQLLDYFIRVKSSLTFSS